MTTTGGTTRSATLPSTILVRVASAGRFGGSGRTFAVVASVTVAGSAFMSGMFMIWCPGQMSPASDVQPISARLIARLLR
jgi:hypothetical protein